MNPSIPQEAPLDTDFSGSYAHSFPHSSLNTHPLESTFLIGFLDSSPHK